MSQSRQLAHDVDTDQADRAEVRERVATVRTLRRTAVHDIVEGVATELHELMESPVVVARPVRHAEGYALDFTATRATVPGGRELWSSVLRRTPRGAFLFDPARPARGQRNVLHELALDHPHAAQGGMTGLRAMGLGHTTQLRMLLCDGPLLLAFLGAYLQPGRSVTDRDRRRLRRFVMGIRPVLRLVAGVRDNLAADALDAMMQVYPGEAYLVHADGRIACANDLGARVLDERGADAQLELLRAVSGAAGAGDSPYDVHPVRRMGMAPMSLLTRASRRDTALDDRLAEAARAWSLSPRELYVLRELANGSANKDIAARGDISLRTVEVHITSLLRKARVTSRLELVVRTWRGR